MVSITECDLRPLPVDIPVSHHCVPEHSWNSLCSGYLGKTVHCLKKKNRRKKKQKKQNKPESIVLPPAPPPHQIIRLPLASKCSIVFSPACVAAEIRTDTQSRLKQKKTGDHLRLFCEVGTLSEVLNYLKLSSSSADAHKSSGVACGTRGRTRRSFRKCSVNSLS